MSTVQGTGCAECRAAELRPTGRPGPRLNHRPDMSSRTARADPHENRDRGDNLVGGPKRHQRVDGYGHIRSRSTAICAASCQCCTTIWFTHPPPCT